MLAPMLAANVCPRVSPIRISGSWMVRTSLAIRLAPADRKTSTFCGHGRNTSPCGVATGWQYCSGGTAT